MKMTRTRQTKPRRAFLPPREPVQKKKNITSCLPLGILLTEIILVPVLFIYLGINYLSFWQASCTYLLTFVIVFAVVIKISSYSE